MGRMILIVVMGLFTISSGVRWHIQTRLNDSLQGNVSLFEEMQARNIANSGAEWAITNLRDDVDWRTGAQGKSMGGGTFDVTVVETQMDLFRGIHEVVVTSTGYFGAASYTSEVTLRRTPYSYYAYFTDDEPEIYFITGDQLFGPVHTNDAFHVSGSPQFFGSVTSCHQLIGNGSPIFHSSADFLHPEVELPLNVQNLVDMAQNGGIILNSNVWLRFNADGTVSGALDPGGPWLTRSLSSFNGVIGTTKNAIVWGVVNGQATVGARKSIYIADDITYASDPRTNPDSDDFLGLVAKDNIIVAETAANANDCVIHATLLALQGSFTVQNFDDPPARGTLTVLGGIVQNTRGPVGTFSGSQIVSGYTKFYVYDDRLVHISPPYYPMASQFSVAAWKD